MKEQFYAKFLESLLESCPINEEIVCIIRQHLIVQKLPKGTHLVSIGEVADKLFYIGQGLVRSYYYVEGKEVTSWIAAEGDIALSTYSFFKQVPSSESLELLEDSQLLFISYPDLQRLYYKHPITNMIGRVLCEKYLVIFDERIRSLRMLNAEERYYRFCQQYPDICARTPLKHIASYLGLSRFTLSRLRGQKIKVGLLS
ncbi:Crp/Fnr family transcriptional regulator [Larkinella terrae]|uniref:Cyclic nucleotide-binding domain-containing protein n=1 Tax=Larkinella terrae TaxID=2025311 RepID=A0A7K0EN33_9BACT|nr:Crp/Fnr family transcriptional regulator [Larkinella terrae]MRS63260.1 cyclic nucleotide-binding domain-containing protein [Larkinella terrae]